ncbi:class I glutamine amidotransferase-like protein [Linderina pennispora]|uniref:D-lactate dehydratase n=1 Tax=Linderina pennispora TaxID=61395 RepID=A0A1Y1WJ85_9FUNG|nr:class I glutamine amidotransferase-like protein [Linderina pennispora]ORX73286.1 class I glutamine amidotransferase-like protein [Linderina pennispora]
MPSLPKRALISITSYHGAFYPNGDPTGLFYTEALHPYHVLTAAGFTVDLASETGSYGMDPHSIDKTFMTEADFAVYSNSGDEFSKKLANLHKASDLNPSDYGLFYASAGHATLFDYPKAKDLINIAESVYERGGVVAAVCHGPIILPFIKDRKTGKPVIEGRKVSGFTTEGEEQMGLMSAIKDRKLETIEEGAARVGATYVRPATPFEAFAVVDGRVVSGTNPASAAVTAEKAVEVFNSL